MSQPNDSIMNLMVAVMERARLDYVYARNSNKKTLREGIEKWLRSESAQMWIGDIGPESIIDSWRKQAAHQDWRERKKCASCNNKSCIHCDPGHYTSPRTCKGYKAKVKKNDKKS